MRTVVLQVKVEKRTKKGGLLELVYVIIRIMTAKSDLLKRLMRLKTSEAIHSSGYAIVQNGGKFGSTSSFSYAERQRMEEKRRFVQAYRNSRIANGINGMPRAKSFSYDDGGKSLGKTGNQERITLSTRQAVKPAQNPNFGRPRI